MDNYINISVVQSLIYFEDFEKNADKIKKAVALCGDSDLILFPEMSFTGFSMNTKLTGRYAKKSQKIITELSQKYNTAIGYGWTEGGKKSRNHYSIIDHGKMICDFVKIHPFSYMGEDKYFESGNSFSFCEINGFKIGIQICYDLRFANTFKKAADSDIVIVPANWCGKRSGHWKTLLAARAIENQCYIVGVNCFGDMDSLYYSGDSRIINPNGDILCEISDREGIINQRIYNDVADYREKFPTLKDYK